MRIHRLLRIVPILLATFIVSCSDDIVNDNTDNGSNGSGNGSVSGAGTPSGYRQCRGADISWLTQMEAEGIKFRYRSDEEGDCMAILKGMGMNAFRFRLWVSPENQYSSTADVLAKAERARDLGMDIMLDFHYSDSWADPSQQKIPAAWEGQTIDQLVVTLGDYTRSTLQQFKDRGIDVKWVQVGNETGNGMLWPLGKADTNPQGYARLNNAGYDAVKSVYPEAQVIVHLQDGQNKDLYSWLFGVLRNNGGKWDVIGMSLYPEPSNYVSYVESCEENMEALQAQYGCKFMLCEVGMGNSYVEQCRDFLTRCFKISDSNVGEDYLGALYWEPQVYNDWNGYKKGAFTSQGTPSGALDAYHFDDSGVPIVNQ